MANKKQQPEQPHFKTDHEAMEAVRLSTGTDNNDDAVATVEEAMGAGYRGDEGGESGEATR